MHALEQSMECPILRTIMNDPVVDPEGYTYEREAILQWLDVSRVSPVTRKPLFPHQLTPNRALRSVIQSYLLSKEVNNNTTRVSITTNRAIRE